jgi:hypothetical protein
MLFMMPIDSFISRLNAFAPYANDLCRSRIAQYLSLLNKLKLSKKIAIEHKEMEVNPRDLYHFIQFSQQSIMDEIRIREGARTTTPFLPIMQEAEDAAIDALLSHSSADANSLIYATYKLLDRSKECGEGGSCIWIDNRPSKMLQKMMELYKQSPQTHREKALLYFQISDELSITKAERDDENYSNFMDYLQNYNPLLYQEVRAPERYNTLAVELQVTSLSSYSWLRSACIKAPLPPIADDDDWFVLASTLVMGGGITASVAHFSYGLIGLSLLLASATGAIGTLLLYSLVNKYFIEGSNSHNPSSFFSSSSQQSAAPQPPSPTNLQRGRLP